MDEALNDLEDFLQSKFSDEITSTDISYDQLTVNINVSSLEQITSFLKLNSVCLFRTLIDITAVDYPEVEYPKIPIEPKLIAHGKRKATSRSKIIKSIATR